jgi:hypothetical protein
MTKAGDSRTQFGPPVRGKGAATRAEAGRTCAEPTCSTVLSVYNAAPTCWMHTGAATRHPLYPSKSR